MALPLNHTTESKWTSTYNQGFRDRHMFISPHPGQPMYHFSNAYDPSHFDGFNKQNLSPPPMRKSPNNSRNLPPIDATQRMSPNNRSPTNPRSTPPRNLWAGGTRPLTGTNSNNGLAPNGEVLSINNPGSRAGFGGFNGFDQTASARAQEQERQAYHIPGYSGFVRGGQFRHGETYSRVTRRCLDVPTDCPLEP